MKSRILHSLTVLMVIFSIAAFGSLNNGGLDKAGMDAIEEDNAQYSQFVKEWKEKTLAKNLATLTKGMDCKDAKHPFLTDKIVVSDDVPNVEFMTFDEAYHKAMIEKKINVVAYCK